MAQIRPVAHLTSARSPKARRSMARSRRAYSPACRPQAYDLQYCKGCVLHYGSPGRSHEWVIPSFSVRSCYGLSNTPRVGVKFRERAEDPYRRPFFLVSFAALTHTVALSTFFHRWLIFAASRHYFRVRMRCFAVSKRARY